MSHSPNSVLNFTSIFITLIRTIFCRDFRSVNEINHALSFKPMSSKNIIYSSAIFVDIYFVIEFCTLFWHITDQTNCIQTATPIFEGFMIEHYGVKICQRYSDCIVVLNSSDSWLCFVYKIPRLDLFVILENVKLVDDILICDKSWNTLPHIILCCTHLWCLLPQYLSYCLFLQRSAVRQF